MIYNLITLKLSNFSSKTEKILNRKTDLYLYEKLYFNFQTFACIFAWIVLLAYIPFYRKPKYEKVIEMIFFTILTTTKFFDNL